MAFGKKYYSSYKSNNNIDYYLEVWLKDYDSTASEIKIGAGGPIITYETEEDDRFSPILSSNCKLPLMVTDTALQTFVSQLRTTYQEKQVYLHLYKATSSTYTTTKPIWSGFLTMDLGSGEDVSFPYEQQLIFVDGLSLLKEIDFVDFSDPDYETRTAGNYAPENMYWGPGRYTFWIKEILLKSGAAISGVNGQGVTQDYGFTTAVNWYNGTMTSTSQSSDPLFLTECKVSMFHTKDENETFLPDNCYDVLKELLRHWGARITYWKHEFWIVQIPEYIVDESGLIDNPDNINSRQYNRFGTLLGSQDHLGDTYSSRYEQTIQGNQISKLVGTKYNYLPAIHRVNAKFLSLNGENHFGGFPFGVNPYGIDFFQSRIANPSSADFLWVSIPLNWKWDMTGTTLPNGHTNGWWARIRFNLYCTQNNGGTITTYYLQYNSSDKSYFWVDSSNWTPLGNESPAYIISSRNLVETDYPGFSEQIEFVDSSGSNISLTGDWDFYISMENYGTSSNNPGSFYCRFSPGGQIKRNPTLTSPSVPAPGGGGATTGSGTVTWSNSLQDNSIAFNSPTATSTNYPSGYNTGTSQVDKAFTWKSPLKGFLQVLNNTVNATYGITNDTIVSNSTNTEVYGFGDLLWGDAIVETARGNLNVWDGSAFDKTNVNGKWGRGTLTGEKTFTQMLIDEFLTGQIQIVISPSMRLVVGDANKDQSGAATGGGTTTRPRYVNPIGRLRESRTNETDPEYFFRRGSFHTLYDEWDYEGYQILRDTITVTTNTNDIGGLGGSQTDNPIDSAKVQSNVNNALMMNSPVAYVRNSVPATGSNVAVNGNFITAVGWTLGSGWSIDTTAKKAKFAATGSTSELTQSVLTQGLTYQVNFQVVVTAGTLLVKAGTSGTSQSITTSGDYSLYLNCDGSNLIKFQAGTTFTGNITFITLKDQKSLSSVPIEAIGSTVFKTGDTFNLINSLGGEILPLTVSSNQGATDDTISVTSTALYDDIGIDSVLLINQDDLSAQYQNKTKGTVAGFGIDADGISKGGIEITGWLNSDTMSGAAVTNVPTALSVKNYVDGQVGASDTLQEVTDNGNTTTNSITFAGGTSTGDITGENITLGDGSTDRQLKVYYSNVSDFVNVKGYGIEFNRTDSYLRPTSANSKNMYFGNPSLYWIQIESNAVTHKWTNASAEKMRLDISGRLLINATSTAFSDKLYLRSNAYTTGGWRVGSEGTFVGKMFNSSGKLTIQSDSNRDLQFGDSNNTDIMYIDTSTQKIGIGTVSPTEKIHVVGDALITGDSHADAFKPAATGEPIKFKRYDGNEVGRFKNNGYFGINVSDPQRSLDIGGAVRVLNENQIEWGWGGVRITGSVSTNTFKIGTWGGSGVVDRMTVETDGQLNLSAYGSGSFTGTETYFLAVTSGGDVVEADSSALPGGPYLPLTGGTLTGSLTGTTATFNDVFFGTSTYKGKLSWDTGKVLIGTSTANTDIVFIRNFNTELARITSGGNLLINTTSDVSAVKLQVNGKTRFGDSTTGIAFGISSTDVYQISGVDVGFSGWNSLHFKADGNDGLFIEKDTNNVGIGTTSPSVQLEVHGADGIKVTQNSTALGDGYFAQLKSDYGTNALRLISRTGDVFRATDFGQDVSFLTGNPTSEKMRILANGNVGIGTSSPANPLHVESSSNTVARFKSTDNRANIIIQDDDTLGYINAEGAALSIGFNASKSADNININSSGNVGIGTVSPSEKLHVVGDALITGDSHADAFKPAATGEPIKFKNFGSTELARITNGGFLGIGSSNPTYQIEVNNTSNENIATFYRSNAATAISHIVSTGRPQTRYTYSGYTSWFLGNNLGTFAIGNALLAFSTPAFNISSTGNIGINQVSPTEKLHVVGNALITGTAKIDGNVSIGGTAGAVYKLDVVGKQRVQSVLELEDVLTLNAISTPADPASNKSSIYMDSADGAIKVKINVGGTVVTRTIASFE